MNSCYLRWSVRRRQRTRIDDQVQNVDIEYRTSRPMLFFCSLGFLFVVLGMSTPASFVFTFLSVSNANTGAKREREKHRQFNACVLSHTSLLIHVCVYDADYPFELLAKKRKKDLGKIIIHNQISTNRNTWLALNAHTDEVERKNWTYNERRRRKNSLKKERPIDIGTLP